GLLPSADSMAWILARWAAGSQQAFEAKMNAAARRLGMTGTRYTDPSGLAASTVSTPADQVLLGRAVMAQPGLAGIVGTPQGGVTGGGARGDPQPPAGARPAVGGESGAHPGQSGRV